MCTLKCVCVCVCIEGGAIAQFLVTDLRGFTVSSSDMSTPLSRGMAAGEVSESLVSALEALRVRQQVSPSHTHTHTHTHTHSLERPI